MFIEENIRLINKRISEAALSVERDPKEISLIAVTKGASMPEILEALNHGVAHVGESRVDQFVKKYDQIDKDIHRHMIGSLQTNKVRSIIDKVEMIHSIDRISLVKEVNKRAKRMDKKIPALIQVNVSEEATKSGILKKDLISFVEEIRNYPYLSIKGLMTIAPLTENDDIIRSCFRELKHLFEDLKMRDMDHIQMKYLSMGMSNDFEIAIEEGANMVRVGRAIFKRDAF